MLLVSQLDAGHSWSLDHWVTFVPLDSETKAEVPILSDVKYEIGKPVDTQKQNICLHNFVELLSLSNSLLCLPRLAMPPAWGVRIRHHNLPRQESHGVQSMICLKWKSMEGNW